MFRLPNGLFVCSCEFLKSKKLPFRLWPDGPRDGRLFKKTQTHGRMLMFSYSSHECARLAELLGRNMIDSGALNMVPARSIGLAHVGGSFQEKLVVSARSFLSGVVGSPSPPL